MSENKFTVKAKIPVEKKSTQKNSVEVKLGTKKVTTTLKKTTTTGNKPESTTAEKKPVVKKTTTTTEKKSEPKKVTPAIEKKPISTVIKAPSIEANKVPDLGLLTAKERHEVILGKPIAKEEKPISKSKVERSAELETIKKAQEAELNKRPSSKVIPKVGRRKTLSHIPIVPIILVTIGVLLIVLFAMLIKFNIKKESPESLVVAPSTITSNELVFSITPGMSATQVAQLISSVVEEEEFLEYLKAQKLTGRLRVGTYQISNRTSIEALASAITLNQDSLLIFDGMTIKDIDTQLLNRSLIKGGEFVESCEALTSEENLSFSEGWFLSGNYTLTQENTASELARKMHQALLDYLKANTEVINSSDYSLSDLIIIASMLNRETQDYEQMRLIASVIYNRLKLDMPLGIDATTRYELDDWTNPIKQAVFEKDTPYNTRRKKGLPPSGIGCVSVKALQATLYPEVSDYLYYLHSTSGEIYLSRTYQEHLNAQNIAK